MSQTAMTNSCWDRQMEEIRRRVNQREFWQDVGVTQVAPHAPAENADKDCDLSSQNSANSRAGNALRAIATSAERSNSDKTLARNDLRRSPAEASAHETENEQTQEEISKKSTDVGTFARWWKFNFVGGIGIAVQFVALFFLRSVLHLNYLAATALAVEIAVLHNFAWHERFTWADRVVPDATSSARNGVLSRLLRFHVGNGAVSILGNLALMKVMVGEAHMNYLAANAIAIVVCSLANFLVSDRWVFEN